LIEFRNVTKQYPGAPRPAVDNFSLTVPEGEIAVFVGPSGCGKTTSMKMANRLIEPTSGEILINGTKNTSLNEVELRRGIGYVIQQIGLFPHRTIGENIGTVPRLVGWDARRIRARADELLELVGLDPDTYRDRYPSELSGGQQQRVGVARALAADPPVMLMDEPFGAVDPIARERLQQQFLDIQSRVRKTIIFVTHDIDEAIKMGDKVAVLQEGGILAQYDAPEALLTRPNSDFVSAFVGSDRAIKRLSLARVDQLPLERSDGRASSLPVMPPETSAKDALSLMLTAGADRGLVSNGTGEVGILTLNAIRSLFRRPTGEAGATEPQGGVATRVIRPA
jgi:osmoprotectant transport system ATP-binding protein